MTTRKQPIRRLAFLSSWASVLAIAAWLTIIGSSIGASSAFVASVPTVVTRLEGSTWTVSYRFSSQPDPKTKNNNNGDDGRAPGPKTFYSGKLTLLLKADGYSERLVQAEDDTSAGGGADNDIKITKIWGWDRETSNEDDLDYLLFSMDVVFPASDPETPGKTDRYYLQARIEESNNGGGIALKDGTITVKKDVTETTGGMWGLFNVAGILTEFRYCGDFAARPAAR
eukprot:jgi/Psemu1/285511/fgenesh1_pg.91_\